jgi:hypothetical protein
MFKKRLLFAPLAGLSIALLVACGGDKKDSNDSSSSGGSSNSSRQASTGSSTQSLDLSKSGTKLADLKSFRFDLSMKLNLGSLGSGASSSNPSTEDAFGAAMIGALLGGLGDIKAEGAFVSPDKSDVKLRLAGQEIAMVQVGDKAWVKFGNTWQATDAGDSLLGSSSPADMFKEFLPNEVLKGAKTKKETVNGVKTTRYSFDKKALEALGEEADLKEVSQADLDIWVNDDNVPVKVTMSMAGKDEKGQKVSVELQMNIKDINGNISIKAPI